jgi:hypothetical protein
MPESQCDSLAKEDWAHVSFPARSMGIEMAAYPSTQEIPYLLNKLDNYQQFP